MKFFDINDLSLIARLKSEIMFLIGQLENEDDNFSKEEAAKELRNIVIDIFDFEKGITEEYISKQ
ncbi:hypothetical protein [Paenibacillus sp. FSL L8-0708]|uniref:hypothetical protein n=1 Tax=Paenibacillus sp. FSL L8-0708 TaxID=2975311 RepID=UPI0030F998C7